MAATTRVLPLLQSRDGPRPRQAHARWVVLHRQKIGDKSVGLVEKPVVVFGRHEQGIGYAAIDARPARLFFLLVTTTVAQHLAILARLSRLIRDPKLRQNLSTAEKPEKIIALIREAEEKM